MESVKGINLQQVERGFRHEKPDLVAVEEPLEIRLGYGAADDRQQNALSVTMRTPGYDFELALGFLFTEGIINHVDDVARVAYCHDAGQHALNNIVRIELQPHVTLPWHKLQRNFYMSSSCGVCGKASIEAVSQHCSVLPRSCMVSPSLIYSLPELMRNHQPVFSHTGGLHAAALFTAAGKLVCLREDVGRHNAVDKVVGAMFLQRLLPLYAHILLVSGRASFELVQKAAMAGIEVMVAVGAPSSLAIALAAQHNMTLIGFARAERFNIYTVPERVTAAS
jgi:FdhD protein